MCPIFASSASNCLTTYKEIISGCSLGHKNALNFTCLPVKFHNRVHTKQHPHNNSDGKYFMMNRIDIVVNIYLKPKAPLVG